MRIPRRFFMTILLITLMLMPIQVLATPYFSLDTFDDWDTALNDGRISPVESPYDAAAEHYGIEGEDYVFTTPELYVWEGDGSPETESPGLVMYWGDPAADPDLPQLASWEYTYPEDPNLTGTKLKLTVMPPLGIWSVSLTLNDAAGGWVSWDWNVNTPGNPLGPGPINPGTPYTITIDPTILGPQAGSTSFALNPAAGFNPTTAISIQADELAAGAGAWQQFPAVPVVGGQQPWNYWSSVSVVPEPISSTLFLVGAGTLGFRRYWNKRRKI